MSDLVYPLTTAPVEKGGKGERAAEMLPIVDEGGVVVSQASRTYCHGPRRPLHPVVHLHLLSRGGAIYLQKRSMTKALLPGFWDSAVGGHISYGEYVCEALYREAGEELGLFDFNPVPFAPYIYEGKVERELVFTFAAVGDFRPDPCNDEVSEGRWWTPAEIDAATGKGILTPLFEQEYARFRDKFAALL